MLATRRAINRDAGHIYTYVEGGKTFGPYPGATAITRLQDSLGGTDGLMRWGINLALDEVERQLRVRSGAWDEGGRWDHIRTMAATAKDAPANLGSRVHEAVDMFNKGYCPDVDERTAPYVAQYGAAVFQKGINILASERYVVNTEIGFGGTYDSLVEIEGERGPLDVKTGKEKASQRLQLTGLSMGQYHGEAGMEAEPMPSLDPVGWILLLRPDTYELIRHEITDDDREHFAELVQTYHRIRAWANPKEAAA